MPELLTVIALIWGLLITLFWMFIGWRAVVAHEQIATSLKDFIRRQSARDE